MKYDMEHRTGRGDAWDQILSIEGGIADKINDVSRRFDLSGKKKVVGELGRVLGEVQLHPGTNREGKCVRC